MLNPKTELARERSLGLAQLSLGLGVDQVRQPLYLRQVETTVFQGSSSELPRLCRPAIRKSR